MIQRRLNKDIKINKVKCTNPKATISIVFSLVQRNLKQNRETSTIEFSEEKKRNLKLVPRDFR